MHQDGCFHSLTPSVAKTGQEFTEHQTRGAVRVNEEQQTADLFYHQNLTKDIQQGHERG